MSFFPKEGKRASLALLFSNSGEINVLLKVLQKTLPLNRRKFKAIQCQLHFLHCDWSGKFETF